MCSPQGIVRKSHKSVHGHHYMSMGLTFPHFPSANTAKWSGWPALQLSGTSSLREDKTSSSMPSTSPLNRSEAGHFLVCFIDSSVVCRHLVRENQMHKRHQVAILLQKETPSTCILRSAGRERRAIIALRTSSLRDITCVRHHAVTGDIKRRLFNFRRELTAVAANRETREESRIGRGALNQHQCGIAGGCAASVVESFRDVECPIRTA